MTDFNPAHLTVRGLAEVLAPFGCEPVEPPATRLEPFDKPVLSSVQPFDKLRANGVEGLRANGIFLKSTVL